MSTPASLSTQSTSQPRVLLVEDETSLREVVAHYLRKRGFEVETASDGSEGLAKLTKDAATFGLVVTDLNMPNMDGIELIQAIRSHQWSLKIIACSSAFTTDALQVLRNLSVDATLPKTTLSESLIKVVDKLMGTKA